MFHTLKFKSTAGVFIDPEPGELYITKGSKFVSDRGHHYTIKDVSRMLVMKESEIAEQILVICEKEE